MRTTTLLIAMALVACGGGGDTAPEDQVEVVYPDADNDGIMDHHESGWGDSLDGGGVGEQPATGSGSPGTGETATLEEPAYLTDDFDGDGTPNYQDTDSDDDGIPDADEAGDADLFTLPLDSDLDLMPNFLDLDSDENCIEDGEEGDQDLDGDNLGDYRDLDNDGDGILDETEIGEDCLKPDSDGDGTPDFEDQDSDGDGIADLFEGGTTQFDSEPSDTDGDGIPDYLDLDSDGDGVSDTLESGGGELWEAPLDTDGDGIYDFADTDSDNDGLSDQEEREVYGTDPRNDDSDGDGFTDGAEILTGADPLDAGSIIEGIYVVVPERTDVQELFPFTLNVQQGDVAFVLDTTCSMGGTLNAMAGEFATIVNDLTAVIPDTNYAVTTFDDYIWGGWGDAGWGDRPYILEQQLTDDTTAVQSTLSGLSTHNGGDLPESAVEGLLQTLEGGGYDQNCNGVYESPADVLPLHADPADPFGGAAGGLYNGGISGTGTDGGVGFRSSALPVVVYATDADMRNAATFPAPGGCPGDATGTDVANAAAAIGARLIGVCVNNCPSTGQMNGLAQTTNSYADLDGDGLVDEPLVFQWSGSDAAFRNTIVGAIDDLVQSVGFSEITLEVVGDDQGFVVDIDPAVHYVAGAVVGQQIDFNLTFRGADAAGEVDELFALTLNVYGDGVVLLDTLDIFVLVPGVQI